MNLPSTGSEINPWMQLPGNYPQVQFCLGHIPEVLGPRSLLTATDENQICAKPAQERCHTRRPLILSFSSVIPCDSDMRCRLIIDAYHFENRIMHKETECCGRTFRAQDPAGDGQAMLDNSKYRCRVISEKKKNHSLILVKPGVKFL